MKQTGLYFKLSKINGYPVDVKAVMDTWTLQMNYPVVTMTRLDDGGLRVTQKRFLSNPHAQDPLKYTSQFGSVSVSLWSVNSRALVTYIVQSHIMLTEFLV